MNQYIWSFLGYMSDSGASGNTLMAYKCDLRQFEDYLGERGTLRSWQEVSEKTVEEYLDALRATGKADNTVARKFSAIRVFFQYLAARQLDNVDPTKNLKAPRALTKSSIQPLSVQEVNRFIDQTYVEETTLMQRDRAMLELLYATGLRVSEIVSLDVEDLDLDQKQIHCHGARRDERVLPIHSKAVEALQNYLEHSRPKLAKNPDEKALFLNGHYQRLRRQGLWLTIQQYVKSAGIATPVVPSTLRRSFAAHMLGGGAKLLEIQKLLGHSSPHATIRYLQFNGESDGEFYERAHPRARITES